MDPAFIRTRDYHPKLHLEWVYGYNGTKCRNNILVLPSEELLYFVAKVAVIFNRKMQQQRFYTEHTDEICSISQHQNQWIIATGQVKIESRLREDNCIQSFPQELFHDPFSSIIKLKFKKIM